MTYQHFHSRCWQKSNTTCLLRGELQASLDDGDSWQTLWVQLSQQGLLSMFRAKLVTKCINASLSQQLMALT